MTKLSDTQSILLTAAAQRADGNLLPLPGSLRGGAATKVVAALLARGLVEERTVETTAEADPALNTLWRNADDGRGVLLRITPAGLDALGIEADSAAVAAAGAETPRCGGPRAAPTAASGPTGRRVGPLGQVPRGHQAGGADRDAPPQRGRDHRRDRRGDRLAAAHGARRLRRRAEEAARADDQLGEGRGARPGLPDRVIPKDHGLISGNTAGRTPGRSSSRVVFTVQDTLSER